MIIIKKAECLLGNESVFIAMCVLRMEISKQEVTREGKDMKIDTTLNKGLV